MKKFEKFLEILLHSTIKQQLTHEHVNSIHTAANVYYF